MLCFNKRNTKNFNNITAIRNLYCSLVRSILEYSCIIWSPTYITHINILEKVQHKFFRYLAFKLKIPSHEINYNTLMTNYNIPNLKSRREQADLIFLQKLINYKIDCPELLCLLNFKVPKYNTRNNFTFPIEHYQHNFLKNNGISRIQSTSNKFSDIDLFFHSTSFIKTYFKNDKISFA